MQSIIDETYEITPKNLIVSLITNSKISLILLEGWVEDKYIMAMFDGKTFYKVDPSFIESFLLKEKSLSQKTWDIEQDKITGSLLRDFKYDMQHIDDIYIYLQENPKVSDHNVALYALAIPSYSEEGGPSQHEVLNRNYSPPIYSSAYGHGMLSGVFNYKDASGLAKDEINIGFIRAAATGNIPLMQRYLAMGADIDATQDKGYRQKETPLMLAVKGGFFLAVRFLVENGAEPKHKVGILQNKTAKDLAKEMAETSDEHGLIYQYLKAVDLYNFTNFTNFLSCKNKEDVLLCKLVDAINTDIRELNSYKNDDRSPKADMIIKKIKFLYAYLYKKGLQEFIKDNISVIAFNFILATRYSNLTKEDNEYLTSILFDVYSYGVIDVKISSLPTKALEYSKILGAALGVSMSIYDFVSKYSKKESHNDSQKMYNDAGALIVSTLSVIAVALYHRYYENNQKLTQEEKVIENFKSNILKKVDVDVIKDYLMMLNQWEVLPATPSNICLCAPKS